MGPAQAGTAGKAASAPPYTVVFGPVMLPCARLNISMSLQGLLAPKAEPDVTKREFGEVARGLRTDIERAKDAIQALAQAYRAGTPIPPIKVLARKEKSGKWAPTGFVVDGAIRVQAATLAEIPEIPADLVVPAHPDTPLEAMFLHYNHSHGARLSVRERDAVLRLLAQRYRDSRLGPRDVTSFAIWLAQRAPGLQHDVIVEATKGVFQVQPPDTWSEIERLAKGGAPTAQQVATLRERGVTVPADGRLSPGQIGKLFNISRAAVEKHLRKAGIPYGRSQAKGKGGAEEPSPNGAGPGALDGEVPDATPELLLQRDISPVDAKATAQDLRAALKAAAPHFEKAMQQIDEWVLKEASEYTLEQAKLVWDVVDAFWAKLLKVNRAFKIYRDAHLAERDLPALKDAALEAESTLASPRRGSTQKARAR
jgi:hypothetical protein